MPDFPFRGGSGGLDDEPTAPLDTSAATSGEVPRERQPGRRPDKGRQFGPYTLTRQLGVGGMGEVWEAEQREPLRRSVALKIIKRGMDTASVISRFEAERQALALMDHPAIARVFDAGETPEGQPFFAMELVRGIPIHSYCDQKRLSLRQRLELMIRICDGVQHAHQKAILHRDLKPSNILVTEVDGTPLPKIIDFGVAKATSQPLTEGTLFTELGQLIGTPEYMSPEQAELTGLDVDTRTDVYSLGVVLYQLLTGDLPFRTEVLRSAGFDGIRRILRDEEPERPSTRVGSAGDTATPIAERRRLDPPSLVRQLTGDLDWIVLKALEKDRRRRYGSPTELAADIQRYLENEPILARPASGAYRARKFVQRHRVGVGVSAVLVLLLLGFSASMLYLAGQLREQRDLAGDEARAASAVSSFLTALFRSSDPEADRGGEMTARELLDRGAERIASDLEDEPVIRARLEYEIGKVYTSLGLYAEAESLLKQALAERTELLGRAHPETLEALEALGYVYFRWDRFDAFEPLQRELVELSRQTFGESHPRTTAAQEGYALTLDNRGQYEQALEQYQAALEGRLAQEARGEAEPYDKREALYGVAYSYFGLKQWREAVDAFRKALEVDVAEFGEGGRNTLTTKRTLAWALLETGETAEAEELLEEVLVGRTELLGPEHDGTLMSVFDKVGTLMRRGEYEAAERMAADLVATRRRVTGQRNKWTASALNRHGSVLFELERLDEARAALSESVDIEVAQLRGTQSHNLTTLRTLIDVEIALGELDAALERIEESLNVERDERPGGWFEGSLLSRRAEVSLARAGFGESGDAQALLAEAEADARRGISLLEQQGGFELGFGKTVLAEALFALGRTAQAQSEFEGGRALMAADELEFSPRFRRGVSAREKRILGVRG